MAHRGEKKTSVDFRIAYGQKHIGIFMSKGRRLYPYRVVLYSLCSL